MFNGATVTLAGYVAKEPTLTLINDTTPKVTMRVAWSSRYQDRVTGEWKDGNTSFANVNCWRKLAGNVAASMRKGNPVVVTGKLRVREFEDREGRRRIAVDIEADSVGHDLSHCVTHLLRTPRPGGAAGADGLANGEAIRAGQPGAEDLAGLLPDGQDTLRDDADGGERESTARDVLDAEAVAELAGSMEGTSAAVPF
jgi:single-strand DNA-binding protein